MSENTLSQGFESGSVSSHHARSGFSETQTTKGLASIAAMIRHAVEQEPRPPASSSWGRITRMWAELPGRGRHGSTRGELARTFLRRVLRLLGRTAVGPQPFDRRSGGTLPGRAADPSRWSFISMFRSQVLSSAKASSFDW
jgi:hypothetical protein